MSFPFERLQRRLWRRLCFYSRLRYFLVNSLPTNMLFETQHMSPEREFDQKPQKGPEVFFTESWDQLAMVETNIEQI